jgi:anti-anti-sigma regulatory factor
MEEFVPFTLEQSGELCEIRASGVVNIAGAADWKQCLLQALASGKEILLRLEMGSEMDVTALQLLWAAEREARALARRFTVARPIPEEVAITVKNAGFEKFPIPVDARAQ